MTILFGIIAFLQTSLMAQVNKFELGLEGGPSLIFLSGNEILKSYTKPTVGYVGGISFHYRIKKKISIRSGLYYENKGTKATYVQLTSSGDVLNTLPSKFNYHYLNIPILVRASLGKKVQYFVNGGPFLAFLLKTTETVKSEYIDVQNIDRTNLSKTVDFGISVGMGLSIPFKQKSAFSIESRYNYGLINSSAVPVYGNESIHTNSLNLMLGYSYRFGK